MSVMTKDVEQLVQQAVQLPVEDRVRLIQLVAETFVTSTEMESRPIGLWRYGAFKGKRMSTGKDFLIAEWRPSDEGFDGG
jgi:hypothetical protein